MIKKVREYGELPEISKGVSVFRCEVCARTYIGPCFTSGEDPHWFSGGSDDLLTDIQGKFVQCPKCGRWVCPKCWDEDKLVCRVCAREIPSDAASEIREELEEINTRISAIADFLGSLKKCQECGAIIIDPKARFCGICGSNNLWRFIHGKSG